MILQQWWLFSALECIFFCISSQSLLQKRQCAFQVSPQNNKYTAAGNVSGTVQLCENTQCCVGYFLINGGQPKVDLLACDVAEKSCPDETCKAQVRFNGRLIKCVCNTDLCNTNITWIPESEAPHPTYSYSSDEILKTTGIILLGILLVLCFMIVAAKRKGLFKEKKENPPSCDEYDFTRLCSCQTTKTSELDISNIELQQIVSQGHFATVWKGNYQGSEVAVKVFPPGWTDKWTAEKEVYELPLMTHAGIVPFLGCGRKPEGGRLLMVLQFAEYGSLHSFLCKHATNWMMSLKLCQSLSQGLSYLHSDLHRHDVHKPPVAHRDLSSFNVLVRADGTCVLCDFGCSTILRSCSGRLSQSFATKTESHALLGTLRYMAPEILEGSVNLSNTWCLLQGDIYALGLLLWEIWMHCSDLFEGSSPQQHLLPYESELGVKVTLESLILHVCYMDKRPLIPKHWRLLPQGPVLQELLADCWDCDPDARLTAQCVAERLERLASMPACLF
ncbi:bone morphogenetic protein receptor type-2-like [Halichoeres trimaculatus]|uniref:bone morphogenetic protein receptor type-2-like n=1 Tax=Halichoeres trimaculatus TaxID=147232 RepID=UPI003D9F0BEA